MKKRFAALDGLRGICAIIVVLFHDLRFAQPTLFAHGYLSVDVFFVLSGFVLAFAFRDKLAAGLTVYEFMKIRGRRLGPVLLIGACLGGIGVILQHSYPPPWTVLAVVVLSVLRNLLLIPFTTGHGFDAFPTNSPSWSLFAEFWINVGFGCFASKLGRPSLILIIGLGWAFLVVYSLQNGSADFGAIPSTVLYSIPRGIPSFACGVLIFDLWKSGALRRLPSVNPLLLFGLWTALTLIPCRQHRALYDLIQILITAPMLVALLARYEGAIPTWAGWAGKISYPLYAIHIPIIYTGQVLFLEKGQMPLWAEVLFPVISIASANAVSLWYEPAFAKLWKREFTPRPPELQRVGS